MSILFCLSGVSQSVWAGSCGRFIVDLDQEIHVLSSTGLNAHMVHVTGARQFPLEIVRSALNLKGLRFQRRRILSIGEGWSPLTSDLRARGAWAIGVDGWYGSLAYPKTRAGDELHEFVAQNQNHLVAARGGNLPFADRSFDSVFSSFVLHHLRDESDHVPFLAEAARVLRPGRRAVLTRFDFDQENRRELERYLALALSTKSFTWTVENDTVTITDLRNGLPLRLDILRVIITRRGRSQPTMENLVSGT